MQGPSTSSRRSWWLAALAVLVALAVGAVGGTMLVDGGGDDSVVLRPDGGELTARQEQMVETVNGYLASWAATDGDLAASFMTDNGRVEYVGEGWEFHVADGSLQNRISNGPYSSLRRVGPIVVHDDRVVVFGTIDRIGVNWLSVIECTRVGDVQIVSESIDHW